jgi:hypothetical protein
VPKEVGKKNVTNLQYRERERVGGEDEQLNDQIIKNNKRFPMYIR